VVAVVGLGAMGSRIARRLLDAGHELVVWNRTPAKAAPLVEAGATEAESPADAARRAEVVITMVTNPDALRAVTEAPDGLAAGLGPSTILVEMSTVGPAAIAELAESLPDGTQLLDAPVLGSIREAERGALHVFVGGTDELIERVRPLLSTLGDVIHTGPLGSGAAAKLVANATLVGTLAVLGEAIALGDTLGLARDAIFDVLAATPLGVQAERRRDAIERNDYPPRFALALARKDADLIVQAARESADVRVTAAAGTWFAEADDAAWGDRDYSAALAWILRRSG